MGASAGAGFANARRRARHLAQMTTNAARKVRHERRLITWLRRPTGRSAQVAAIGGGLVATSKRACREMRQCCPAAGWERYLHSKFLERKIMYLKKVK